MKVLYKIFYFLFRIYCRIFLFSPYITACAIIVRRGKVLLINQADGSGYGLPGGIVKYGESVESALLREVKEETGFDARIKKLVLFRSFNNSGFKTSNVGFCYRAQIVSGFLKNSFEGKPEFHSLKNLPENLRSDTRFFLEKTF